MTRLCWLGWVLPAAAVVELGWNSLALVGLTTPLPVAVDLVTAIVMSTFIVLRLAYRIDQLNARIAKLEAKQVAGDQLTGLSRDKALQIIREAVTTNGGWRP